MGPRVRPVRAVAALCLLLGAANAGAQELPAAEGRDLVYAKCRLCHDLGYVRDSAGIPAWMWGDVMDNMVEFGLEVTPSQRETILSYLTTYLGPDPPPPPAEKAENGAPDQPDGAALYRLNCAACHGEDGAGQGKSVPALEGNPALEDADHVVRTMLQGRGADTTSAYNGVMPSFRHLGNAELAALATYVLQRFASRDTTVTKAQVAGFR